MIWSNLEIGEDALYNGHLVTIEEINLDLEEALINNPMWEDDFDTTPFWIWVSIDSLTKMSDR